jgi:hypothetical protein
VSGTNISEQRKHRRFKTPKAIVVYPGNVCRVLNISTGGLSFQCFLTMDVPTKWSLDIIIAGTNFLLRQLPVELVWKAPADQSNFLFVPVENAGVKFNDLHQSQTDMLDNFLTQF